MNARLMIMVLVLNAVTFGAAQALAQQPPPKPAAPLAPQPTVSIQFPGGSLADYVKALKDGAPTFNIVMLVPEAREIKLPPIKLDSVAFGPAVGLLSGEHPLGDSVVKILVNDLGGPLGSDDPGSVYKIWSERRELHRPPAQVRVWSIGELLGPDRKADDVLTAVETAVGLLEGYPPAKIRYHAETNLIVASGEEEQLHAIDRVVNGIRLGQRMPGERHSDMDTDRIMSELLEWMSKSNAPPEVMKTWSSLLSVMGTKDRIIAELREQVRTKTPTDKPSTAP